LPLRRRARKIGADSLPSFTRWFYFTAIKKNIKRLDGLSIVLFMNEPPRQKYWEYIFSGAEIEIFIRSAQKTLHQRFFCIILFQSGSLFHEDFRKKFWRNVLLDFRADNPSLFSKERTRSERLRPGSLFSV